MDQVINKKLTNLSIDKKQSDLGTQQDIQKKDNMNKQEDTNNGNITKLIDLPHARIQFDSKSDEENSVYNNLSTTPRSLPGITQIDNTDSTERVDIGGQHIFLFVNPASGGNAAATFMEAGLERIRLTCPNPINLWIWDIRQGKSGNKPGFLKLRHIVESLKNQNNKNHSPVSSTIPVQNDMSSVTGSKMINDLSINNDTMTKNRKNLDDLVFVIAAGGDGTVMWCITEVWAHNIDNNKIAYGVVPYGTGNDFARAFGWQKFNAAKPYEAKFKGLKELIKEWLNARLVYHDIWEVSLQIGSGGEFQKIDSTSRLKKSVTGVKSIPYTAPPSTDNSPALYGCRCLTLKMCNYFSMGVESRIGIGFDRYRTKSQCCNKLRYAIEGTKKAFFKKTHRVDQVVSELAIEKTRSLNSNEKTEQEDMLENKIIFTSNISVSSNRLLPAGSIIALNIPSFAAGLDLWSTAKRPGVSGPQDTALLTSPQKLGDGIIEFISFKGIADMGLERAIKGRGKRVAQGDGPFKMSFKQFIEPDNQPPARVYFQVDGEFFIMTRPELAIIKWKRRIKVLASNSSTPAAASHFVDANPSAELLAN